jgi:hypothetical protein
MKRANESLISQDDLHRYRRKVKVLKGVTSKPSRRYNNEEIDEYKLDTLILTGEPRHMDHIAVGQLLRRQLLPTPLYYLFSLKSIFFISFLASHTNGTFGFAQHSFRPFAKPKESFHRHFFIHLYTIEN